MFKFKPFKYAFHVPLCMIICMLFRSLKCLCNLLKLSLSDITNISLGNVLSKNISFLIYAVVNVPCTVASHGLCRIKMSLTVTQQEQMVTVIFRSNSMSRPSGILQHWPA